MSPVQRFEHGSRVPGWRDPVTADRGQAPVPDPESVAVPAQLRAEIEAHIAKYPEKRSATLPALAAAQRLHGWCSPEAIEQVACVMQLTPAELTAVASFYDMLDNQPKPAEHHDIYVCTNISCSLRGADALLAKMLGAAGDDGAISVRPFECLGACEIGPMVSVDGAYIGPLEQGDAEQLLADLRAGREPLPAKRLARRPCADACGQSFGAQGPSAEAPPAESAAKGKGKGKAAANTAGRAKSAGGTRAKSAGDHAADPKKLLLAGIDEPGLATLEGYRKRGGYAELARARAMSAEHVLGELEASGLRGRGGAGFKMATKISFLPKDATDKYLVCNADESEPGTFKDRELIQKCPHRLIEGIAIACHAAGIERAYIYIRGEYAEQASILEDALAEAQQAGLVGGPPAGSEREGGAAVSPGAAQSAAQSGQAAGEAAAVSPAIAVHRGAGAYICGEETGLLDSLEGKRGNPRLKPPFPAIQGLYQGPTLINNVETLSTVPAIMRLSGAEYAKLGTENSTGTKLISISGQVRRPGNYEIELGVSAREIIYGLAGGPAEGRSVKCWFPGGSSSPVLTADELDLSYDFDSLAKAGSMLGSGAIIVVDDSTPILDVALKVARFYAHESCGKCTPCREGTSWTAKMVQRMRDGQATPMDLEIMASVQQRIIGRCLCVLGDAMAMPIASLIKRFRPEIEAAIEAARAQNLNTPAEVGA